MKDIDQYINHCRLAIGDKPSATDEEINTIVKIFSPLFPNIETNEVKKILMTIYSLPIKPHQILLDHNNPGSGWLTQNKEEKKQTISWNFWTRYLRYLREHDKYESGVLYQLDKITDEILDNLFDPNISDVDFSKKGLVVGQVQSGKTSNFTGLICKAVDAGFNVVIVFAGILDDLRTQTQSRLEKCFLGFTTKDITNLSEKEVIGVGSLNLSANPIAHAFTTVLSDFKEKTVSSLGANFQTKEPILFVVKKNSRILSNLKCWLKKKDLESKSVLFIDDEADNASINTSKDKKKASTINRKVREILSLFGRKAYVGYTATPYANIFIDRKEKDDLFPRHFIINLPTPSAYLSPEKVFGLDESAEQPLPIVNVVRDYKNFVPDKHKKDDYDNLTYENFPESLKYAIRCFILACAVRCARGQKEKHNSMLIHLSRFQIWQNKIKDLVNRCFQFYRQEIMADDSAIFNLFQETYEKDYSLVSADTMEMIFKSFPNVTKSVQSSSFNVIKQGLTNISWTEVKPQLYRVVDKIEVKSLNGASSDVLAYDEHEDDGYYVIAIGGDKLSRGLTLEGLTISYFLRASKMYDTLMQMGRWFGYRPGYVDVCRLFVSEEINTWFKNITIANHELREEFDYLWETKGSPAQYALKVRTSPGLLVTSPLKMQSTKDVQLSWASTLVETYSLVRTHESKEQNFNLTSKFLSDLGTNFINTDKGYLWKDVPFTKICEFIGDFQIADTSRVKLNFEKMVDYINTCVCKYGELQTWRVVVKQVTSNKKGSTYFFGGKNTLGGICTDRTIVNTLDPKVYNLKNYHLISGPEDEFLDIDILGEHELYYNMALEETKAIKQELHRKDENIKEWDKKYPSPTIVRQKFRPSSCPLLIIYPLNPLKANLIDDNGQLRDDVEQFKQNELPFIGFAIVFPPSENSQGVKYKINEIQDFVDTEITFDSENDNTYADE